MSAKNYDGGQNYCPSDNVVDTKSNLDNEVKKPLDNPGLSSLRASFERSRFEVALTRVKGEMNTDKMLNKDPDVLRVDDAMVQAVRGGKIIELDISDLAQEEDPYKAVFNTFSHVGLILRSTLNQTHYDVQEVLEEVLSNAFVHGNKLDFHLPLFLSFKPTPDNNDVYHIEIFDVANDKDVESTELAQAKKASLTGRGRGVGGTIEGQDWDYQMIPPEKSAGRFYTRVGVFPNRQGIE